MEHVVGISDMKVSSRTEDVLITYSIGSCLGVTVYDPVGKLGGMMHCMLPLSKIDVEKAKMVPCMFVDTGLSCFLAELFKLGAKKDQLIIKVAGASNVLDNKKIFRIAERNYTVLRTILTQNSIPVAAEDIGGTVSRTLKLCIKTGKTYITSGGMEREL